MADGQFTAQTWDFGRDLRGYKWPAPNARASLLLTHGFAEYAERYVERYNQLIPHLNELGFDVYAFDMRGHGRSPGARGVADIKRTVEDHKAARRALAVNGKPIFLFGHSLGGLVTAASVADEPNNVAGVVLSAPGLLFEAPAHLRVIANVFAVLAPGLRVAAAGEPSGISRIEEEVEAYKNDPMISGLGIPAKLGVTAVAVAEKAWTQYPRWTAPVLVFHGVNDQLTASKGSERFVATIGAKDKRLELYPEARHEILNDLNRDAAMSLLSNWLSERIARA
ncbi:MAG: alpha/beta hydrolase [Hyphomonadaceae bacterium]